MDLMSRTVQNKFLSFISVLVSLFVKIFYVTTFSVSSSINNKLNNVLRLKPDSNIAHRGSLFLKREKENTYFNLITVI
jgi:hypothetical protein